MDYMYSKRDEKGRRMRLKNIILISSWFSATYTSPYSWLRSKRQRDTSVAVIQYRLTHNSALYQRLFFRSSKFIGAISTEYLFIAHCNTILMRFVLFVHLYVFFWKLLSFIGKCWSISSCVRYSIGSVNKSTAEISAYLVARARYITRVRTYALSRAAAIALSSVTARSAREGDVNGTLFASSRAIPLSSSRCNKKKPLYANSMSGCVRYRLCCIAYPSFSFFLPFFSSRPCFALGFVESGRRIAKIFFPPKHACTRNVTCRRCLLENKRRCCNYLNWEKREKK